MKLFNAITASAVIGTSLIAATSAEAFWGWEKVTMENFWSSKRGAYRAMRNHGTWEYGYTPKSGGREIYLKIGCKGGRCLFLQENTNAGKKDIPTRYEVDCVKNQIRSHPSTPWFPIRHGTPGMQLQDAVCS